MKSDAAFIVAIDEGKVLVADDAQTGPRLPYPSEIEMRTEPDSGSRFRFDRPIDAEAVPMAETAVPAPGLRWVGLRETSTVIPADHYRAAAKAAELLHWDSTTRFCGVCGERMERHTEISKRCLGCGREIWPSLSPAAIVLVKHGDKALLVHAKTFSRPFYGLVAGFVETGESIEETVEREVKEETNLHIRNIRYFGSQTWPFPAQLMIGFTADYAGGELKFADGELTSGGFFSRDSLPLIPGPPSIARKMIDAWLAETPGSDGAECNSESSSVK